MEKMKRRCFDFLILLLSGCLITISLTGCNKQKSNRPSKNKQPDTLRISDLQNTLTEKEISEGWVLLFDGRTSNGWINAKTGVFPSAGWIIENGTLSIDPEKKGENGGGDIVTTQKYGDFELTADFLYTPGANSGIKYFVDTEVDNGALSSIGCEYQILDDKLNEDAKAGISGNHTLAALYDLIPPQNVKDNGTGTWNTAVIKVNGSKVQHWLNGRLTVEYERGTPEWRAMVAKSKYKDFKGFGEIPEGRILLQDHGGKIYFRNIKIRETN